jgi:peptide/nickel transport system permease protein
MAYVEAARAAGSSGARILFRHIGPNTGPVLVVAILTQINRAIVTEATISFLGLGVQPPLPTWGNLLIGAQEYVWTAPWLAIAPGVAITVSMLTLFSLTSWQSTRAQIASAETTRIGQR